MSSVMGRLPATTVAAVQMLATANCTIQELTKALAQLGCSCTVKTREIDLEAHGALCRYKQKMLDLELS